MERTLLTPKSFATKTLQAQNMKYPNTANLRKHAKLRLEYVIALQQQSLNKLRKYFIYIFQIFVNCLFFGQQRMSMSPAKVSFILNKREIRRRRNNIQQACLSDTVYHNSCIHSRHPIPAENVQHIDRMNGILRSILQSCEGQ